MPQTQRTHSAKVEVVENPALDAYRRHLQDNSDYRPAIREYLDRSRQRLEEAVKRRAADSLAKK